MANELDRKSPPPLSGKDRPVTAPGKAMDDLKDYHDIARTSAIKAAEPPVDRINSVVITTAVPLEAGQKENIVRQVLTLLPDRKLSFIYRIDPRIIGGIIIQTGDKLIDGSIRGRLQNLAKQMSGAPDSIKSPGRKEPHGTVKKNQE
jgi:hypothetical protein